MRIQHDHTFAFRRTDLWREGEWLDLWSVVHFLSGISIGLGLFFLHFGILPALVTTFIALVAYEMWETLAKIEETRGNRVMDVVVGMGSFLPSFFFFAPSIPRSHFVSTFMAVLLLNVGLSVLGWNASHKATALEQQLRTQYARQRSRLRQHRRRLLNR